MISTIFAMVVIAMVIAFSLYMASEIHDYMANDNVIDEIMVLE